MSTTEIILEHLISGIQASIWLGLALLTAFGYDWMSWEFIKDMPTELTLSLIAVIYPIGIFIDELADYFSQSFTKKVRESVIQKNIADKKLTKNDAGNIKIAYILKNTNDDFLKVYFGYIRTRIRIARASSLNLLLITIALAIFLNYRTLVSTADILVAAAFSLILTCLAAFVWYQVTRTFVQKQIDNFPKSKTPLKSGVL